MFQRVNKKAFDFVIRCGTWTIENNVLPYDRNGKVSYTERVYKNFAGTIHAMVKCEWSDHRRNQYFIRLFDGE